MSLLNFKWPRWPLVWQWRYDDRVEDVTFWRKAANHKSYLLEESRNREEDLEEKVQTWDLVIQELKAENEELRRRLSEAESDYRGAVDEMRHRMDGL